MRNYNTNMKRCAQTSPNFNKVIPRSISIDYQAIDTINLTPKHAEQHGIWYQCRQK